MEWHRNGYTLTDERERMDTAAIQGLLSRSYWAQDRTAAAVAETVANSLCFGLFYKGPQIGLGRFVTDKASFSWFCDFIVAEEHRGKGLGQWMLELMLNHPDIRRTKVVLGTRDAHTLYEKFGFERREMMRLSR